MATDNLKTRLAAPFETTVYYFASVKEELALEQSRIVLKVLAEKSQDPEVTRIDGPVPDLGLAIAAAGAISFFGTPRIVELRLLSPSTMTEKDIEELCGLFGMLENAVMVVTAVYKDKKTATSKKAKALFLAAQKVGFALELAEPGRRDNLTFIEKAAVAIGAEYEQGAAEALLENAGADRALLESETAKLAAISGYRTISKQTVNQYSVRNIEADVFELARLITGKRRADAFKKLNQLLALRNEPIAIAAALSGTYVDMYRVRCGAEERVAVPTVFEQMGYKGSDYRLQKAKENAARYSVAQLENAVLTLAELDGALKSSALPDKSILLETAVAQLLQMGERH